jgi:hypothetical protein
VNPDRPRPRPKRRPPAQGESEPETRPARVYPTRHMHSLTDRYEQLLDGRLTVDDLDDEEIIRGRLRNAHGDFRGSPPQLVPYTLHRALQDVLASRVERRIASSLPEIIDAMVEVGKGTSNSRVTALPAQVQAATWLIERVIGKTPDKKIVEQTVTARWEEAAMEGRLFVDVDTIDQPALPGADDTEPVDAEIVLDVDLGPEGEIPAGPMSIPDSPRIEATPTESRPKARPRPKTGIRL